MRGEPTGPLPTPNPTVKRRYEATPSAVTPRPLAPHTDMEHLEDGRMGQKKAAAMSPPRTVQELAPDRNLGRYPPLAQATGAPATSTIMSDDPLRSLRQSGAPPAPRSFTGPGPRMGYFTEDRREARTASGGALSASRGPELQPSPRVAPTVQTHDVGRMEPLPQQLRARPDFHGSPGQYQPGQPPVYMQAQQGVQPSAMPSSHSRNPSLTGATAPGSPAQQLRRHTPDISPIRRSSFGQTQPQPGYYGYAAANVLPKTTVSPVKELPAPSAPSQEPPRQVPAKRSNIMSILNDEPEELPPRKRFASEMVSSPRLAYGQTDAGPATSNIRHEGKASYLPTQQQQPSHGPPSGRPAYADYPPYAPSLGNPPAGGPPNHDWMARFDPRSQTQQSAEPVRQASQGQYGAGYQPSQPASNSQPPTPSQGNAPSAGHRGYQGYPPPHGQGAPTPPLLTSNRDPRDIRDSRDLRDSYRHQNGASPPPHQNVMYGSRQVQSPAQSPAPSLSMPQPRQPSGPGPSYSSSAHPQTSSPHPLAPQHRSSHSGHQSYQQHVQAMVNGQQGQPAPSTGRPSIGMAGGPPNAPSPYGSSAPASQQQHQQQSGGPYRPGSLGNPLPRPFTPPSGVHAPPPAPTLGGIPYPNNGPGGAHMHHNAYPHPHEPQHPSHHRVYSQGGSAPSSR